MSVSHLALNDFVLHTYLSLYILSYPVIPPPPLTLRLLQPQAELDVHRRQFVGQIPKDVRQRNRPRLPPTQSTGGLCLRRCYSIHCRHRPRLRRGQDGALGKRRADEAPTLLADVGEVPVGAVHEPVVQEVGSAVRQEGITLHFSKADATMPFSPLDGLPRQLVHGARRTDLRLV